MSRRSTVISADSTVIAYEEQGVGDPVVLVEPPLHRRGLSAFAGLAPLLARHFTVYTYDRRGRGESTDTLPYSTDREVDDLEAVLAEAGGSAFMYGYSGGALLALHAAARGLPIPRLALMEPPLHENDHDFTRPDPLTLELGSLLEAGDSDAAVVHFLRSIGVPAEILSGMREAPEWGPRVEMAHTLLYDCMISDATTPDVLASVTAPTLVLDSAGSTDDLTGWAATAATRLPNARHRSLEGQWHGVADDVLAPVLAEFFCS